MTAPLTRVNFLFLGGDKCGSTWLDVMLRQHPEVSLANAKELFFFDRFYDRGFDWYDRQFPDTGARRTGEICHDYLHDSEALARIGRALPEDARCLIILRHPIARTLSHYRYLLKIGATRGDLGQAIMHQPRLITNSLYASAITEAFEQIGRDRIRVLFYDDLQRDPQAFGQQVSAALDIPFLPDLPYDQRVLGAARSRAPGLTRALRNAGWWLRARGGQAIVGKVKSNPLVHRLLFTQQGLDDPMADRAALQPHLPAFAEDQRQLTALLGPLPDWPLELP